MDENRKKRKAANAKSYPVDELCGQARELFGVSMAVAAGALADFSGNRITVGQMKQRIEQFMKRKVSE